jgi:hypothetical protein
MFKLIFILNYNQLFKNQGLLIIYLFNRFLTFFYYFLLHLMFYICFPQFFLYLNFLINLRTILLHNLIINYQNNYSLIIIFFNDTLLSDFSVFYYFEIKPKFALHVDATLIFLLIFLYIQKSLVFILFFKKILT